MRVAALFAGGIETVGAAGARPGYGQSLGRASNAAAADIVRVQSAGIKLGPGEGTKEGKCE